MGYEIVIWAIEGTKTWEQLLRQERNGIFGTDCYVFVGSGYLLTCR